MILLAAMLALFQDKGESVSFTTIDKGSASGFTSPQEMFVSSLPDWAETWMKREGPVATKKNHPAVDFDKDVVIVAALGMQKTGGFSIEITRIVKTKDAITVFVRRTQPPAGSAPGGGPTSPFVLARMKKPDRPVTFQDEEKK